MERYPEKIDIMGGWLMILLFIIIFIVLIAGVWGVITYNKFISLGERVTNGKAQIATQIESRWDAVTSLINATKRYSQHEVETLESIVEKRVNISENSSVDELEKGDTQLNNVVGRLIAISENYPDLKASDVYQNTMNSINEYENNVRHSRMIYNDVVTRFNRLLKMFPSNLIASIFNFKTREYFQATQSKEEMPAWD